jgi:hypothetical protein
MQRPFSGRLVFDHFPKTAGQAINAWLRNALGDGSVSPNSDGCHRELLKRAGEYPIISAHVHYADAGGLDPRFQYATLLREPMDRTISWLYFVAHNHERDELPGLYEEVEAFLASDGRELASGLGSTIVNPMVNHYAAILGHCDCGDQELLNSAFLAIQHYDCVGIYERLAGFVAGLAELIGIPAPAALQPVNVTVERPAADGISDKLRNRLLALTDLDRQLYRRVATLVEERLAARPPRPPEHSKWARYDRPAPLEPQTTPSLRLHGARQLHEESISAGKVLRFELEFDLYRPVKLLQAGLHIFDDRKRWAFGVNNRLLDQPLVDVGAGRYHLVHLVTADLPAGDYTIGFSFADVSGPSEQSLYWHDQLLNFKVHRPDHAIGVGSSNCLARMTFASISNVAPAVDFGTEVESKSLAA